LSEPTAYPYWSLCKVSTYPTSRQYQTAQLCQYFLKRQIKNISGQTAPTPVISNITRKSVFNLQIGLVQHLPNLNC